MDEAPVGQAWRSESWQLGLVTYRAGYGGIRQVACDSSHYVYHSRGRGCFASVAGNSFVHRGALTVHQHLLLDVSSQLPRASYLAEEVVV